MDKLKLKLHILFCSTCSSFSKRNKQLSEMFGKAKLHVLSDSSKKDLKQQIRDRL